MVALSKLQAAVISAREAAEARKRGLLLRKKQFEDAGDQMKRLADVILFLFPPISMIWILFLNFDKKEYASVLKQIEETQWSLKELK